MFNRDLSRQHPLPGFLVIGGMKCGSTTFYHDLCSCRGLALAEKESSFLTSRHAGRRDARRLYARRFAGAAPDQLCGEVSTTYAMLPDHPRVAASALRLLGSELKVVYLVRDPVARAISHHYHMHSWNGPGKMRGDFDTCLESEPSLLDYGRYAMQLRPWRDLFGDAAIQVIVFEEFIRHREKTLQEALRFLGVSGGVAAPRADVHNRSDGKAVLTSRWHAVVQSTWYRRWLRPYVPSWAKEGVARRAMTSAPHRPPPPSSASIKRMIRETAEDRFELQQFLGRTCPVWDYSDGALPASHKSVA